MPLLREVSAAGKSPVDLAQEVEDSLKEFVVNPSVTVIVSGFVGLPSQQVRVVGAATDPQAIPFTSEMTLLDVMISVGGLTEFASGNRSTLIRAIGDETKEFKIRLDDLLQNGDMSANVEVFPGDIILVPESVF